MIETEFGNYKKWKNKDNKKCDYSVGVDYSHSAPLVIMCKNPAQYIFFSKRIRFGEEKLCNLGARICESCLNKVIHKNNTGV